MPSMTVKLLPIAQDDVDQALAYIAADNPDAADVLLEDILKKLAQAAEFPPPARRSSSESASCGNTIASARIPTTYFTGSWATPYWSCACCTSAWI